MVGHLVLVQAIGVRAPVPEPRIAWRRGLHPDEAQRAESGPRANEFYYIY